MEGNKITYFAETDARGNKVKFGIRDEDRLRHVYSIGKTGMGKSTMLENMAIQDIQNGNGMAFLDPHGKTADLLLDYVPEHRIKDVIYFAPFDTEYPISFNVMEDVGPERRHLVVAGLMSAFEKIWVDAWSARMAYILQNTLAALLEYPGATMLGINRMLTDKVYRNEVVENVKDPTTKSFWTEEFAKYTERFAAEATPAIQNKVGQFTSNPLIRNIVGQSKSSFDIRKIMDEKKILIVNLSKGLVGENNANLLGSMIVTKIYLAAMSRADVAPQDLKKLPNFYLYVDEFQSFANKSFADILSESRKYKLSLNITHQYIEQMAEEVRSAVFGNVGTLISFRVGSFDAEVLEKEFAPIFTAEDIVNLGFVQIYLKLMIEGVASQPFSATTLAPIEKPARSWRAEVLFNSRQNFAFPRDQVQSTITKWHEPIVRNQERRVERMDDRRPPLESRTENAKNSGGGEYKPRENFKPKETERSDNNPQNRNEEKVEKKTEFRQEPKFENRVEQGGLKNSNEPKDPKKNVLADAIAQAVKEKQNIEVKEVVDVKPEPKPISLNQLKVDDKKKDKSGKPENINALKEALQKVAGSPDLAKANMGKQNQVSNEEKKEFKKEEIKNEEPPKYKAQISNIPNEVPEETLRKILKGE